MNSALSAGTFSVPLPDDLCPEDLEDIEATAGFHDVDYHSGEESVHDGTDWDHCVETDKVSWAVVSQSTNALRWGTLYNFRFEVKRVPVDDATVTIGLFETAPDSVEGVSVAPAPAPELFGACCNGESECVIAMGCSCPGYFYGAGTTCTGQRACCLSEPDHHCIVTTQACCDGVFKSNCLQCGGCSCPYSTAPQPVEPEP